MSASVAAKKDFTWLFVFIYLAIVALFFFVIPPIAPITEAGMRLLGVFIAAIFGWSIAQTEIWPSLLTFILLPFVGLTNLPGILGLTWGTDTFLIIIFMMILVGFLESSGRHCLCRIFLDEPQISAWPSLALDLHDLFDRLDLELLLRQLPGHVHHLELHL